MKFEILKPEAIYGSGKKDIQEDCMFPALGEGTIHDRLFIVADGKGGDGKGFRASEYLCKTVGDFFYQNTCSDEPLEDDVLDNALQFAREKLNDNYGDSLGASFALLYFHRHGCLAAHVGNSKVYHIRPKERLMLYKSIDNNGVLRPGDGSNMTMVKANITQVKYGDYFLLMTQGAKQMVNDDELMDIVCEPVNDKTKMLRLGKYIKDSDDNYSVYLVHVSGVMNEALDENLPDNERQLMEQAAKMEVVKEVKATNTQTTQPHQDTVREIGKQQSKVSQQHVARNTQHLEGKQQEYDHSENHLEERQHEERSFPVVTATACLIVLMALGFWFWSQRKTEKVEEAPVVEVKKPQGKDTINIMKNAKPKPLNELDDAKAKEEEKKKEEERKKRQEQLAAESQKEALADTNANNVGKPVLPEQVSVQEKTNEPAPAATSNPAPPAKTTPVDNTPPANQGQQSNGDPSVVMPRPVIPEGE